MINDMCKDHSFPRQIFPNSAAHQGISSWFCNILYTKQIEKILDYYKY